MMRMKMDRNTVMDHEIYETEATSKKFSGDVVHARK